MKDARKKASGRAKNKGTVIAIVFAALMLAGAATHSWTSTLQFVGLDFYQWWMGADALRRGENHQIYDLEEAKKIGTLYLYRARTEEPGTRRVDVAEAREHPEFYGTPALYSFFKLFPATYETAFRLFVLLSILSATAAVVWIAHLFDFSWSFALLAAAFVLLLFEPLHSDLRVSNVNALQLLFLAVLIAAQKSERGWARLGGSAIVGAAVMFKPNIALVPIAASAALLLAKRYRLLSIDLCGYVTGALCAAMAAAAAFGSAAIWRTWFFFFRAMPPQIVSRELGNVSLRRYLDQAGPRLGLIFGIAIGVVWAMAVIAAARRSRHDSFATVSIVLSSALAIMLFASDLVWLHYVVLYVPLLLRLLSWGNRPVVIAGAVSTLLISFMPLALLFGLETINEKMFVVNAGMLIATAASIAALLFFPAIPAAARR
jgi:hypothetical protein